GGVRAERLWAGAPRFSFEDVNGDGRLDLVLTFANRAIAASSGVAELRGLTFGGRFFAGQVLLPDAERMTDSPPASETTMTFRSQACAEGAPQEAEFASTSGISIPNFGTATPYPSTIAVSGLSGVVSKVTVTLNSISHTFPDDIDILLVGPTGQSMILMSDVGGVGPGVVGVTVTFDDNAKNSLANAATMTSGVFKPS